MRRPTVLALLIALVTSAGGSQPGAGARGAAPAVGAGSARSSCARPLDRLGGTTPGPLTAAELLRPADFEYIGTFPSNCRPGWTNDLQGVTHDSLFWYFTQKATLWRFPVDHNLGTIDPGHASGVVSARMPPELSRDGYNHFGALAYYAGLLLIPVSGRLPPVVAVVRARDLAYLGHLQLPAQGDAGWLAIGPQGELYSSDGELDGAEGLFVYGVDWPAIGSGRLPRSPSLTDASQAVMVRALPRRRITMLDEAGQPVRLRSMQGGVFNGAVHLYTVNGYCQGTTRETGISAFAITADTGRRVAHSSNHPGPYEFEYHPGHRGLFWCREEPEGLTIWDLDDGRAPGIRGQLHVLMIDNAIWDYGALFFRHYRLAS